MSSLFDSMREQLGYMLSLPERTMRSLAAVAGGTTSLLTETLVPESLRDTRFYQIMVGDAQRFVVEQVGQVQSAAQQTPAEPVDEAFVQRKVVGGALEAAGLFAMHLSPVWVFALASDAAAGGGVFLNRLVEQLKRNGVIPKHTEVKGLSDLLGAIQDASGRSATAVNTPPLTREELSKMADDLIASYRKIFSKATNLVPRLETIWQQVEQVARRENVSVERLIGVLTVDVAEWGRRGIGTILAVGRAGSDLVGEQILSSYGKTLDTIKKEGLNDYVSSRMKPFLQTAVEHFDPGRKTWTESILNKNKAEEASTAPSETACPDVTAAETAPPPPPPPPPPVA